MICKGVRVAMSAYGRVIHCRELLWVLQVVGSNPAAPTNLGRFVPGICHSLVGFGSRVPNCGPSVNPPLKANPAPRATGIARRRRVSNDGPDETIFHSPRSRPEMITS